VDATTGAAGINQIAYTWQLGNGMTFNIGAAVVVLILIGLYTLLW